MGHSSMRRYPIVLTLALTPQPCMLPPYPSYCPQGDGNAFKDYLEKHFPDVSSARVDRAETSKRQDWSLEASYEIFPLLEPLMSYTVGTLLGEKANLLRDSLITCDVGVRSFRGIRPR
jgi:hypothetical protein